VRRFLEQIKSKLEKDRAEVVIITGTTIYSHEQYAKRVGYAEGLQRAIDIITEISKSLDEEELDEQF
jgi:flagellin-specific chaperone FliS